MKRTWVILILLLAFVGLADSAYLAQSAANGTPLLCDIEKLSGCNIVAASPYAKLFGIPLADFGVLFYSILFALAALELVLFDKLMRRILQAASLLGALVSIYFTLIQAFVINVFCIYCIISAAAAILIFALATLIEPLRKREDPPPPSASPTLSMPPRP